MCAVKISAHGALRCTALPVRTSLTLSYSHSFSLSGTRYEKSPVAGNTCDDKKLHCSFPEGTEKANIVAGTP